MDCWIQSSDFESEDLPAPSPSEAAALFENHDWASSLRRRDEREDSGEECCAPGFGLVAPDGRIVHLCPELDGSMVCHDHFEEPRRILGFLFAPKTQVATWQDSLGNASRLIHLFFDHRHEDLLLQSRQAG